MDEKVTRKDISDLVNLTRKDYPFIVLQELIAEIILNTQTLNETDVGKRYMAACNAIFGTQKATRKKGKYRSKLYDVFIFMRENPGFDLREACTELARKNKLPDYKIGEKYRKLTEGEYAEVSAKATGLLRGIKAGQSDENKLSPTEFRGHHYEMIFEPDNRLYEAMTVKRMFAFWTDLYSETDLTFQDEIEHPDDGNS